MIRIGKVGDTTKQAEDVLVERGGLYSGDSYAI